MRDFTADLNDLGKRLDEAEHYLGRDELRSRRPQLETEMGRPDLWDDADLARKVQTELSAVVSDLDTYDTLSRRLSDAQTLYELGLEEGDDSVEVEITASVEAMRHQLWIFMTDPIIF